MVVPPGGHLAKGLQPGEKAFDFPATAVTAQRSSILGLTPSGSVGSDQFGALLLELIVESVTVVSLVGDKLEGRGDNEHELKEQLHQRHLVGRGACCADSDRKTMSVDHCHDLGPLAPAGLAHFKAPFFAETNIASMKLSLGSIRPRR